MAITHRAVRARLLWFEADPATAGAKAVRFHEDGGLLVAGGRVAAAGDWRDIAPLLSAGAAIDDRRPLLLMPGFIDPHIHFPQTQVIASFGEQLIEWLTRYTFVEEARFFDDGHARAVARFFLRELVRNGTTTACAFGSVHARAAHVLFEEAHALDMRMIAGKVMMDANAPDTLRDTAEAAYRDTKALIAAWHGRGRQTVAISPRFAVTSSAAQLDAAGALAREHPDCPIQTHLAENLKEIELALSLHPGSGDYLGIYERHGLAGPRSLFGHCIHLSLSEWARMATARAVAVFCPTSNLFLGSGLFDWRAARASLRPVRVGIATDVGAGTSYSMLRTLGEAYKVLQLQGVPFDPLAAFHAITRGNAAALGLEGVIGSFAPGAEADAVALDARATPAMAHRMERVETLAEELFVLMTMGDDRAVRATYIAGKPFENP
jgi:guanine deaminase